MAKILDDDQRNFGKDSFRKVSNEEIQAINELKEVYMLENK